MPILRTLLGSAIDYAGLFPPASHAMSAAIREYAQILESEDHWALGRFVIPAAKLGDFRELKGGAWKLAAIAGNELGRDIESIGKFNAHQDGATVDTVEFRAITPDALRDAIGQVPGGLHRYAEWPLAADPGPFVAAVREMGVHAKFRTGGIVEDAFPEANMLLGHLAAVIEAGVPFKCTAGLHHPVRGQYRFTYDRSSAQGKMYGFLNVMLAAASLQKGLGLEAARSVLLEEDPGAFHIGDSAIECHKISFDGKDLERLRSSGFESFGSCSFRDPVDELKTLSRLVTRDS
ncbi:MAG TPA: hypothetical protein VJU15_04530 [Gemmatimonadales bacterium]|nr:hypothetical protein [Gemmatimonadales bacterium]